MVRTGMMMILPLSWAALVAQSQQPRSAIAAGGHAWLEKVLEVPYGEAAPLQPLRQPSLTLLRQDFEQLERNRSVYRTAPMRIGSQAFSRGLGTHSVSHLRIESPQPIARLVASIGVDNNVGTKGRFGSVVFCVSAGAKELYRSGVLRGGNAPPSIDVDAKGATVLDLHVENAGDGPSCDHADWADARIVLADGTVCWLDALKDKAPSRPGSRYPFSFRYGGRHSNQFLSDWPVRRRMEKIDSNRTRLVFVWTEPKTGLQAEWTVARFADFPAVEWLLNFENTGSADTPILEDLQALDVLLESAQEKSDRFVLHKTHGGWNEPTNHGIQQVLLAPGALETMSGFNGHSNRKDFPYFRVDTGSAAIVVAVGWSGQWRADLLAHPGKLHLTAGQETTHFKLHPGERVRTPRMLLLNWSGEPAETSSQFRRLLLKHYVPRWHGQPPLPALYCNTCFSRGGSGWWLNQCNAENQIALIRAMKPLGIEAVITDAGWFKGEWPNGAGNWDPDPAKYPQGMAPVAAAARQCGGIYGLWFEVERAVLGTPVARQHPEWLLSHPQGGWKLVNFGLRDVRAHFSNMLDAYLRLPGFHVYRQDCNIPTLPYWRAADLPDRQGITEMKYIAGLYDYWDAIRQKYPEAFLEECSGAGPRTDLETVMRFRTHQISECYDNNTATQGALMGIGQYLPNGVVMTPLFRLDDYSFHSAMASALCLGWPAEDPKFDTTRARLLCERYRQVRRLFNKDWYPLTPYSLDPSAWLGVQFNAPEDHEGVILVFRREQSPQPELRVSLRGVDPKSSYELTWQCTGRKETVQGASLRDGYLIRLPEKRSSALILYRKTTSDAS